MHQPTLLRKSVFMGVPVVAIFFIDQVTKLIATPLLQSGPVQLVPGVLQLKLTFNYSLAFGLFTAKTTIGFLIVVALVLLFVTYVKSVPNKSPASYISLGMIVGGALGNIVDRLRLGYVIDFINIIFWSVFNVADIAIVTGLVLLIYKSLLSHSAEKQQGEDSIINKC